MNKMPMSERGAKNKTIQYKKADLVAHCVDGELWGRYPPCPKCGKKSTLRVTYEDENPKGQGKWKCNGYWDTNISAVVHCNFNYSEEVKSGAPQTRLPWRQPGDAVSDDEAEDVNAGMAKPVEFPEDMGTLPPQEMAKKMMEICREHQLTLPKDDGHAMRECYTKLTACIDYNDEYDVKFRVQHAQGVLPAAFEGRQGWWTRTQLPRKRRALQSAHGYLRRRQAIPRGADEGCRLRQGVQTRFVPSTSR